MALEGDLRIFRLPDILQVISQQQKTGILTVQGDQDILAVSFLRGDVVSADALNQNFERGLGEVLASQGLVRPEQFAEMFEEQRNSGQRLADFLVGRGVLTRGQLLEALRQLTYSLLLQVLRWRQGEFKFYSGDEVSFEDGIVPLPVAEVLMRSLGDLMGEGTLSGTLPHGFVAYERTTSARPIRVIGRDGTPPAEPGEEVWVSADEQILLERLDGERTAEAIGRATGLGEYKTLFGLFRLLQAGLVRPTGTGPERTMVREPVADSPAPRPTAKARLEESLELPLEGAGSAREVWIGRLIAACALVATALLFTLYALRFGALALPYPWMRDDRAAFERQQRVARALAIDRGARTFFLLEGHYPDRLEELVGRRILRPRQLMDPSGHPYRYRADAVSYLLETVDPESGTLGTATSESIAGDFAVDPEFFGGLREDDGIPLILLD